MSEELNKELENEVTEEVKEAAPMETMRITRLNWRLPIRH